MAKTPKAPHMSLGIRRRGFEVTRTPTAAALLYQSIVPVVVSNGVASDFTWSYTVTGSAKGAQAGYIRHCATAVGSSIQGARIYQVTDACVMDLYFERVLGETGAISINVSTFDMTQTPLQSTTAGIHYTSVTQTVTFTDGEIGWKKVSVPILSIPQGFGQVGIAMTGNTRYAYSYGFLQGTGVVAGAKFLASPGPSNSAGNTSGSGSFASPWANPAYAVSQMGSGGGVIYHRGGTYRDLSAGPDYGGGYQLNGQNAVTNPLILMPYPGEQAIIDNGNDLNHMGSICFGNRTHYNWLIGLHATNGNITTQYSSTLYSIGNVLWKCESDNIKRGVESNVANFRYDWMGDTIAQDCYFHDCYSLEGGSSNAFNSYPSGVYSNCEAFKSYGCHFTQCKFDVGQFGVFSKDADPGLRAAVDVTNNLFLRAKDAAVSYQIQGGGSPPTRKGIVAYNAYEGAASSGRGVTPSFIYIATDGASAQSSYLDVFGNVSRLHNRFISMNNMDHVRYWNNICEDSVECEFLADNPSTYTNSLEYADGNEYVRGSKIWRLHYNQAKTSLAAWRAVSDAQVANAPDLNSTTTNTTPSYTNAASYDYRRAGATNRGQYIGNGNLPVGIQNT